MANLVFNQALSRIASYASLPLANDALVMVALESTGLETDAVLRDKDSLADILSGTTNEQTTVGRKTLSNVTVVVNDTDNRVDIDCDNVTWTSPTGNAVGAFVICYDPDVSAGIDSDLIPLTKQDLAWTPDGVTFALNINTFYQASSST